MVSIVTVVQYAAGIGVVALGCLPVLLITPVRTRLARWPTGRLAVNYLLIAVTVALGQWAVILFGWERLHIGSTRADPPFRALRLIALFVGYPTATLGVGVIGSRLLGAGHWLTFRTVAALGATVVFYVLTVLGASLVVLIIGLFTALPT